MTKIFYPDRLRLIDLGFNSVADIPVLFDRQHRYHREVNRYLRDRGTGDYFPNSEGTLIVGERPQKTTIRNIAYHLSVFIDWCHAFDLDWRCLDYKDCLAFQDAMSSGNWSPSRKKLSPRTANMRTDEVTSFLQWAHKVGLRTVFAVPLQTKTRSFTTGASSGFGRVERRTRVGRLKSSASAAVGSPAMLPTRLEVATWLQALKTQRGTSKYLACRFILETGVRLHEVAALEESQIPSIDDLDKLLLSGRQTASLLLTVTKGSRPRNIQVCIQFLLELRKWIETRRLRLKYLYSQRTNFTPTNKLFISDSKRYEGTPISTATIYNCFTTVFPRPNNWTPHFGRHTYACLTVLDTLRSEALAAGSDISKMGADWINARGVWILRSLQRQLGHLSDETTELYLRLLNTAIGIGDIMTGWHAFLSQEEAAI